MRLYLLRHGIAEDPRPGFPDRDRVLTAEGRKKLRDILKMARAGGVKPTLIVSSPYRRAVQTAEVAARELGYEGEILKAESLVPDSTPQAVWSEVRTFRDQDQVLMTGHEPLFSHLMAYLLRSPNLLVDFKKGAMARIDLEAFGPQPRGVLRWLLTVRLAGD